MILFSMKNSYFCRQIFDFPRMFGIYLNNINGLWSMGDSAGLEVKWDSWDLNRPGGGDRRNISENNWSRSNCQCKTAGEAADIGLLSDNCDRFDREVSGRHAYS